MSSMKVSADDTILDIGVTSDQSYDHSNYLEAWYPHKARVIAVSIDDARVVESLHPGVKFVQANGLELPFRDGCFDYIHSSAVLEHIGQHRKQIQFLREVWRVARAGIFVTTPNRWFPVEFHTVLPLLHWLPKSLYRKALRAVGMTFFASEQNLNLLSRRDLALAAQAAGIQPFTIHTASLLSMPTNLLLIGWKEQRSA